MTTSSIPTAQDLVGLEQRILAFWRDTRAFEKLRERGESHRLFSFLDGPITANNPMGIHHAWGRTLKDVFLRYRAKRGELSSFQNGFDTQGLWVEVEVEKALGFTSKRDIEAFGLANFAEKCKERIQEFSKKIADQSIRLGQWMDWDHSYFTHSDQNIVGIWHFLRRCHEREWVYRKGLTMPWCTRCGTSLSEHEMAGSHREVEHLAVFAGLPLADDPGLRIVVWTTTPWTLAANVAAAVRPNLEYCEVVPPGANDRWIVAHSALERLGLREPDVRRRFPGRELVGRRYETFFPDLPAQRGIAHRIVAWEEVSESEGTGIVHIAPGCGREDHELGVREGLPVLSPVDEAGVFRGDYGWLAGRRASEVAQDVAERLRGSGKLMRAEPHRHSYPVCWRCKSELIYRLVDEWFISCAEIRGPMIEAARTVEWSPAYMSKRMEDWLQNMGDWCISRKRFWGLPLPFYPCEKCGRTEVVESLEHLRKLAVDPADVERLPELHRPWIDAVRIRCEGCGEPVARVSEVGDCWLDAGIVPYTTLGYFEDRERWEQRYPVQWICEMQEQVRLWFYSMLFMGVTISGRAPYQRVLAYERVVSESGQMFSKTGFMIPFDEAVARVGADPMRYLYCSQSPSRELRFSYAAGEIASRRLQNLWNVFIFFVTYAEIDRPDVRSAPPRSALHVADRWLLARTALMLDAVTQAFEAYDTPQVVREIEDHLADLSNWYVRVNRRRFWRGGGTDDGRACYHALFESLRVLVGVLSPITPFLCEELWQRLVRPLVDAPESVHHAAWPETPAAWRDDAVLARTELVRGVVRVAHNLRSEAGLRVRQPLQSLLVRGSPELIAALDEQRSLVLAELNVKELVLDPERDALDAPILSLDFQKAGPHLRNKVDLLKQHLLALDPDAMQAAVARFDRGEEIDLPGFGPLPPDLFRREAASRPYLRSAENDGALVAIDTRLTPALESEGLARDLVRRLQVLRKETGLAVTERIELALEAPAGPLRDAIEQHADYIAAEVLAARVLGGALPGAIAEQEWDLPSGSVSVALRSLGRDAGRAAGGDDSD